MSVSPQNIFFDNQKIKQKIWELQLTSIILENNAENICKKVTAGISANRLVEQSVDQDTLVLIYSHVINSYSDF